MNINILLLKTCSLVTRQPRQVVLLSLLVYCVYLVIKCRINLTQLILSIEIKENGADIFEVHINLYFDNFTNSIRTNDAFCIQTMLLVLYQYTRKTTARLFKCIVCVFDMENKVPLLFG